MRCLYCGKELALLKRLTGGGEFCSDAHKQCYQEEYDRIALSRLLQAQKKAQKTAPEPEVPPVPPADLAAPAAVEEPVVELTAEADIEAPEIEASEDAQSSELPEFQVPEAGFLLQEPTAAELPEPAPSLESSAELALPRPAVPKGRFERVLPDLSPAGPVPLGVPAQKSRKEIAGQETNWAAQFSQTVVTRPSLPRGRTNPIARAILPALDRPISITVPLHPWKVTPHKTGAIDFHITVQFRESALVALPAGPVEFAAEESGGIAPAAWKNSPASEALGDPAAAEHTSEQPAQPGRDQEDPAREEPSTPHATLEALSKLHEVMQRGTVSPEQSEPAEVEHDSAVAVLVEEREETPEAAPGGSNHLLEIPIKLLPMPKRVPVGVSPLSTATPPLIPRLKGLPLRPKVARAPSDSVPKANTATPSDSAPKAKTMAPSDSAPKAKTMAPSDSAPKAKTMAPSDSAPKAKTTTSPDPKTPAETTPASSVPANALPVSKPQAAAFKPKTLEPTPAAFKPAQAAKTAETPIPPGKPAEPASKRVESLPGASAPEMAKRSGTKESGGQREQPGAADAAPSPKTAEPLLSDGALPSFGSLGRPASFWGSFKVKFGIGVLVLAACAAYFGLSGKSAKIPVSIPKASADSAGPSIILGEGGWVVGWGGDTAAPALNREITFYRPSLKLSDYRIEFQGDIENKSLGWVFRAADPDNYYAMKLTAASAAPPAKVALFKYIVAKGHATQVGRVPVDLDVESDTVFKVRVDVRGPKFSTYVQSQPVDVWTDDQLKSGGVGFLNEHGERGRIKSVSIRYLSSEDK